MQLPVQAAEDLLVSKSIGCVEGGKQIFRQNFSTETIFFALDVPFSSVVVWEPDFSKQDTTPHNGC